MDDLSALERQIAGQLNGFVGPALPVDDAAIFSAITATHSARWRFRSMFTAAKLVVAGAFVALVGGFLLAGVLTQPSDDQLPGAEAATDGRPASPVAVTGYRLGSGSAICPGAIVTRTEEHPDGVTEYRGASCVPDIEWSDARLDGTLVWEGDIHYLARGAVFLTRTDMRIENDEGAWRSRPTFWAGLYAGCVPSSDECAFAAFADPETLSPDWEPPASSGDFGYDPMAFADMTVFDGEGAYEGLTFILDSRGGEYRGVIVEEAFPQPENEVSG